MAKPSVFDLRSNYAFYGAYHSDLVNKLIHVACVWPILFASTILLHLPAPLAAWPAIALPWGGAINLSWALLGTFLYMGFYLALEHKAGSVAAVLVAASFLGSHFVVQTLGGSLAWKVATVMEVFCWTAQFVGHGIFEGRAPALLDNLVQAFLMAPFFVLLEVLHALFNFEPEKGFWKAVDAEIKSQVASFRAAKVKSS